MWNIDSVVSIFGVGLDVFGGWVFCVAIVNVVVMMVISMVVI